jgi:uncharacterized protein YbjT (DUF2867 family)
MQALVAGGTGLVGSRVVRELVGRGVGVTVLSRDAAKIRVLPGGVTGMQGDLGDPETVMSVFEGADVVVLVNAVSPTEGFEGLAAVTGMRAAAVRRLVYVSAQRADEAAWVPHFGMKVAIEAAIKRSGIPYTILRPNNLYQNDYYYQDALLRHEVYPQPIGDKGLSRVDVRDVAEAVATVLTTAGHDGETYELVGSEVWTGSGTARVWSQALGKSIAYVGNDLDVWQTVAMAYMPEWLAFECRHMYAYYQACGIAASVEAVERVTELLGHPPRGFRAFVAETAATWMTMAREVD